MEDIHISIAAEKITEIYGVTITNSLITTLLVSILLVLFSLVIRRRLSFVPDRLQSLVELTIEAIYSLVRKVAGKHSREFFPLVMTLFIFILISNWLGLLPGFGALAVERVVNGHRETLPLLRAATADLNTTLALSLVAMTAVQYYGIKHQGFRPHLRKFVDFSSPLNFFIGLLELVSEFAKIISFSFRLFGNIFAGEVLLVVIGGLVPLLAPLPFLGLEIFVGFIQAAVFAVLTLVFLSTAVERH